MPELSRFFGMIISMVYSDNDRHKKPHVHVYYNEYEASIGVDGELLAGNLPVRQMRIITGWLAIHEQELYDAWNKAVKGVPFGKIPPLQ